MQAVLTPLQFPLSPPRSYTAPPAPHSQNQQMHATEKQGLLNEQLTSTSTLLIWS